MKKYCSIVLICILFIFILTGCFKSNNLLSKDDYILSKNNTTSKGIAIGSNSGDFVEAYKGCEASVIYADDTTNVASFIDINDIDYSKQSHVALPIFFVDNKPITVNNFNEKYKVNNDINTWLDNNNDFLEKHTLEYKCLVFTFENDEVSNISCSEKNFK